MKINEFIVSGMLHEIEKSFRFNQDTSFRIHVTAVPSRVGIKRS